MGAATASGPQQVETTERGSAVEEQRRDYVRAPLVAPVLVEMQGTTHDAGALDLSEGGLRCALETAGVGHSTGGLSEGDLVEVTVRLPDGAVTAHAEVVRLAPDGMHRLELALRFHQLTEAQADAIRGQVFAELRALRARGIRAAS